jgi:hypothetical protein
VGGDESQGVPLLASCHARIWTCAFAARASLLLNSNRLREQVCGRWKEVTKPGPPRGTPPRCKATWQDAGVSQVRGARRPQRRRAGSSDPKAHGGAPRSAPSPPSSLTARSRSSRSSPAPASVRRPTEASAARRDPWARSDADWTPIEGPPDASQHAPTAPRNARLAREAASRAACGASRPRPRLLERTSALLALWTCRRRAMLNRLARDATGMKLLPTTRHRGVVSHVICVHVCMCVYVSVWPSRRLLWRHRPGPRGTPSYLQPRRRPEFVLRV